jgi:hypothetical protein
MKRICVLVLALSLTAWPQGRNRPPEPEREDPLDQKLPSGKTQRDEIAKADHKKNVEDAAQLALLATEIHQEMDKTASGVVSVKMLKKLDDMDKLTHAIRGRLKRY